MRKTPIFVALSLLGAAGAAGAQAPKPAPAEERGAAPGPRLNLKLDDAARYTRETPREDADGKGAAGNLPSLGGDSVSLERAPRSDSRPSPIPKDTEAGR
jgi:hypothetical protein